MDRIDGGNYAAPRQDAAVPHRAHARQARLDRDEVKGEVPGASDSKTRQGEKGSPDLRPQRLKALKRPMSVRGVAGSSLVCDGGERVCTLFQGWDFIISYTWYILPGRYILGVRRDCLAGVLVRS